MRIWWAIATFGYLIAAPLGDPFVCLAERAVAGSGVLRGLDQGPAERGDSCPEGDMAEAVLAV